jgi:hypothetical protein
LVEEFQITTCGPSIKFSSFCNAAHQLWVAALCLEVWSVMDGSWMGCSVTVSVVLIARSTETLHRIALDLIWLEQVCFGG